jgi:hypothetical protein
MKRVIIALVLAGVTLSATGAAPTPAPPRPPGQGNAAAGERGSADSPIVVRVLPTQQSAEQIAEDKADRSEKRELDRRLVGFNGDLAHYTLLLAILAALQFVALAVQAIFLRLAFKEAKRSGDIARDAMIAGERAFVFAVNVRGLFERNPATKQYHWRFRPLWKNFGDTPTRDQRMHTRCEVRTTGLPAGFDFDYPTTEVGRGLLPPNSDGLGGQAPLLPHPGISPQDILDVQAGKKYIYLWGWIRYRDVFPNTPQRITRFCWMITVSGNPTTFDPTVDANSVGFSTVLHTEGNCADEECGSGKWLTYGLSDAQA